MSDDIFDQFDNATQQYNSGNFIAWHQFMVRLHGQGIELRLVSDELWCANSCIMLPDEGIDDNKEL